MPLSATGLVVFISLFIPVTLLFVAARIWAVRLRRRRFCAHDYLIFVAELFSLGLDGSILWAIGAGVEGHHITDVTKDQQQLLIKSFTVAGYLWLCSITTAKLSVLLLMLEIFGQNRVTRYIIYIMEVLVALFAVAILLSFSLHCRPFRYNWDHSIPGVCGNIEGEVKATAAANLSLDVLIWLLPQPIVWRLQMDTRRKISVSVIFGVGLLLCMINLLRAITGTAPNGDFSYNLTNDSLYACLEAWLGIIVACLSVIQPVVQRLWRSTKGMTNKYASHSSYSSSRRRTDPGDSIDVHLSSGSSDNRSRADGMRLDAATTTTIVEHINFSNNIPDNDKNGISVRKDWEVHVAARSDVS